MAEGRERSGTVDFFVVDSSPPPPPLTQAELRELLSEPEQEMFDIINDIRKNPQAFITRIENDYRAHIDGEGVLRIPGEPIVRTRDGTAAAEDAIEALRELSNDGNGLPVLQFARGLILAAQDHVGDQWKDVEKRTGHRGTDESTAQGRGKRYGEWRLAFGESLCYGEREPFRNILHWIVDDGIENRSNRQKILDPKSKYLGIAYGAHKDQGSTAVLLIAQEYEDDIYKIQERTDVFDGQYKSARKRNFYKKNTTVTKSKRTGTRFNPNKRHCVLM